jgi:WS/DGAT/MGAT family acyltransferase
MRQLGPLDSLFLAMETPETPAHIGGLSVLDPSGREGFDFEHLRSFLAGRLRECPELGFTLREVPLGLDRPAWVDTPDYAPESHIRRVAVPAPGGARELAELAGFLYARPLDRSRPLWEIFVIEGLAGGRVGLLWKVHHCLMDGMSGAGLGKALFDVAADPAPRAPVVRRPEDEAGAAESGWRQAARGLRNAAERRASQRKHLGTLAKQALASAFAREREAAPVAPRVNFNGAVGRSRALAWTSVSLDEVKALKTALGVTVNDVVLALSSAAVRRYLEERGELPAESLWASVPVSLRKKGDTRLDNQVRDMTVRWATDVGDPLERIRAIHASTREAKQGVAGSLALLPVLGESLPPALVALLMRASHAFPDRVPLPANACVSNVPFAPVPFYIGGARVEKVMPISMLAPTQGLNLTVVSYCGEIHFGFTVDAALVPNPWALADGVPKALVELREALAREALA